MNKKGESMFTIFFILFTVIGAVALMRTIFVPNQPLEVVDSMGDVRLGMPKKELPSDFKYLVDFGAKLYSPKSGLKANFGRGEHIFSIESLCREYGQHTQLLGVSCGDSSLKIQDTFGGVAKVYCNSRRPYERFYQVRDYSVAYVTNKDVVSGLMVKVPAWIPSGWGKCA